MGKHGIPRAFALAFQVLVAISFLMMFFVIYGARMEKKAMTNQINFVVDRVAKLVDSEKLLINSDKKKAVLITEKVLDSIKIENSKDHRKPSNLQFILTTIGIVVLLFLLYFLMFRLANSKGFAISITDYIGEAAISVIVIAIVEYYFIATVSAKYIYPGDADMINRVGKSLANM